MYNTDTDIYKLFKQAQGLEAQGLEQNRDLLASNGQIELQLEKLKREYGVDDDDVMFKFFKIFEKQQKSLFNAIMAQDNLNKNNIFLNTLLQKSIIATKQINNSVVENVIVKMNEELELEISGFRQSLNEASAEISSINKKIQQSQNNSMLALKEEKREAQELYDSAKKMLIKAEENADTRSFTHYLGLAFNMLSFIGVCVIAFYTFFKQ